MKIENTFNINSDTHHAKPLTMKAKEYHQAKNTEYLMKKSSFICNSYQNEIYSISISFSKNSGTPVSSGFIFSAFRLFSYVCTLILIRFIINKHIFQLKKLTKQIIEMQWKRQIENWNINSMNVQNQWWTQKYECAKKHTNIYDRPVCNMFNNLTNSILNTI